MKLEFVTDLILKAIEPFNFRYTVYKPSHFPTKLEYYNKETDVFYRSIRYNDDILIGLELSDLEKSGKGSGIYAKIYSKKELDPSDLNNIRKRIIYSYGLEENINNFYSAVSNDIELSRIITALNGMRNSCIENLFEILNISLFLQNANVRRSQNMMQAMLTNFGCPIKFGNICLFSFYTPKAVVNASIDYLRSLKIGYRAKYAKEIANFFYDNNNIEYTLRSMPFNDAKKELMKIKGIGPYSANLALFAYLKHPNLINFDVWNKKILSKYIFGREDINISEINNACEARWGDFKGYACLYIIEDLFIQKPELQYWRERK